MTDGLKINRVVDHLFRHESGKLVAVLTRIFGPGNLDLAEDVVQDALVEALNKWTYQGIPANPQGWLYKVARNKAINVLNREKYKRAYETEASRWLQSVGTEGPASDLLFSETEVLDDQLRMMFICCHPTLKVDSQIALMLKTLCGFSIREIAKAFLTTEENIHKRLVRARLKIRESKLSFELPVGHALENRLPTVLAAIYLLFNEGYNASAGADLIRYEVCEEAIRLVELLVSDAVLKEQPDVFALLALMQLNACRFNARVDQEGNLVTLEQQDRGRWDLPLMKTGLANLQRAVANQEFSAYHILALISSCHCCAPDYHSTNWKNILGLYDMLTRLDDSPLVLLNRAIAVGKVHGAGEAAAELERLNEVPALKVYHLFHSVKADVCMELEQYATAGELLQTAIDLAPLPAERAFLERKLAACKKKF
ncbi:MAG TPA: sigma-70 family RNA polymerase sigma factor [Puia sp.]|nr:sigma-70 family RNA polymerase sigma factor [Puia sp.]